MRQIDLAFDKVAALVKDFQSSESVYKSPGYSEAQARKDFIDKFWIALGWDVNHEKQTNPYEQEVKVEKGVTTGGTQRRADYAFYLAPNFHDVRFYVEAKKPAVDVESMESYFQLIRYGWNSETPLAVLTDFEQFHILDCRYRPNVETALSRAVAKYHYTDYSKRKKFAEIYWLLSREAVADGSLEKRAKELPKPRGKAVQRGLLPGGYQSMDDSFLSELDEYRTSLARNFKNHNPAFDSETLTELAQRTIDRLVFLRFLEDKGIEEQRLVEHFGNRGTVWEDFIAASRRLDGIYNGIVYKLHDILDDANLRVDDNAFADICESLAHTNSPYDFNAIPIHILGSIYERFLGKVIVATAKRARVEEKPEVRKAGGVYYTPEYIVRYIVENTVGKLIAGKTPAQIAKMRFADIACGSGSFLLGVFDLLLQYHGQYYNDNPRRARKGDCIKRDGRLFLSLSKKREILLNNIYGVDIDAQAVEVCQLSLYLKLLQEETEASAHQYLLDFAHTAQMKQLLPDLSKNIVCGNSLIGRDILDGQLFATDEERKLNPMDFEDAFPSIMKRGGFDAIVGNPPWVDIKGLPPAQVDYFFSHYDTVANRMNLYAVFMHRAMALTKRGGRFGYITPSSFLTQSSYERLRRALISIWICTLTRMPDNVFDGVTAESAISIFDKRKPSQQKTTCVVYSRKASLTHIDFSEASSTKKCDQATWSVSNNLIFSLRPSDGSGPILDKIQDKGKPLIHFCEFSLGLTPYDKYKGHTPAQITNRVFHSNKRLGATWKKLLNGGAIQRYNVAWAGKEYINYGPWLGAPRGQRFFTMPRIIVRQIVGGTPPRLFAGYTDQELYHTQVAFAVLPRYGNGYSTLFFLALLNSQLITWYHRHRYLDPEKHTFQKVLIQDAKQFPILAPNLDSQDEQLLHDELVARVEAMMEAKKQLSNAKTDKYKTYYENKCSALDRQIDRLVYELYDLTDEEIDIVEGAEIA